MFRRIFGPGPEHEQAADLAKASLDAATAAGDTATVRRIVARLEQMPAEQARLVASAAYTLARAAHADLDISDEETAVIERELQAHGALDEPTAVLVTEMAKLQARTVGGTEDYVVTRDSPPRRRAATDRRPAGVLRGRRRQRLDLGGGVGDAQPDRQASSALDTDVVNAIRAEFHERLSSVQAVRRIAGRADRAMARATPSRSRLAVAAALAWRRCAGARMAGTGDLRRPPTRSS